MLSSSPARCAAAARARLRDVPEAGLARKIATRRIPPVPLAAAGISNAFDAGAAG